jgi:glycosyltransferase involved in cell wall biosynthesis
MIAYHFPPEGSSSGVLRTLKFSKYLPDHGYRPHVLTLRPFVYAVKDRGLLAEVPGDVAVHRTFALDTTRHLALRGRHPAFLAVPDRLVTWLPFAVARGLRVIRRERVRALYSTCPVPTAHLVALALKRMTALPWIADFRDPWIEEGLFPRPGSLRYRIESALHRRVLRAADRVTVTTPYLRGDLLAQEPALPPDRVQVIYNGYDEADFADLPAGPAARFEIVHAGMVTLEYRDPTPLLEAVSALLAEGRLAPEETRLTFLGGGGWLESRAFAGVVGRLGLAGVVEVAPRVDHRAALARMARAAALLVLQASDDTRSLIPAKAFEYLRIGRPVLALTLEGATADVLNGLDACWVVNPADGAALRSALLEVHDRWRSAPATPVARPIGRYERRRLTAELAAILDELTSTPLARPRGHAC